MDFVPQSKDIANRVGRREHESELLLGAAQDEPMYTGISSSCPWAVS